MPSNYLIDDFNDGIFDSTKFDAFGETAVTESGGKLVTAAGAGGGATRACYAAPLYDLTKGHLCIRLAKTGTAHVDVYTYFGIRDTAGKVYSFFGRTSNADMLGGVDQLGASTSTTNNDTAMGLGPTWAADVYLAVAYDEPSRTLTFSRSSTLTAWNVMRTVVVNTPTFAFRRAGLIFGMSNFATGSSSMVARWDDYTYNASDTARQVKVRFGGGWVLAEPKVRVAGAWKRPITRVRSGGNWNRPNQ